MSENQNSKNNKTKKMKKIICFIAFIMSMSQIFAQKHGKTALAKIEKGSIVFLVNQQEIAKKWIEGLKAANVKNVDEKNFQLISIQAPGENRGDEYMLMASSGEKGNQKSGIALVLENGKLYERLFGGGGGSITCSGCAYSCYPDKVGTIWICTSGCIDGNCTKTVTLATKAFFD